MNCEQAQERLVALLHHELNLSAEREVLEHAAGCSVCREDMEQTRAISIAVRDLIPAEPSARERRRLQERILNATGGSLLGKPPSKQKALPPIPETRMLPGPEPTRLLGFQGPVVETTRSVTSEPAAEARATVQPESRRVSHRIVEPPSGRMAAWAGLLCWVVLGLLVLAAGLLAAAYTPRGRAKTTPPSVSTKIQRTAESRWNERRLAKLYGHYTEAFLMRGSVKIRDDGADGSLRVLPHFVPVTGEMCLVLYRDEDVARLLSDKNAAAELSNAVAHAPTAALKNGSAELPWELVDKFIGAENRATVLTFSDRIEIWSSTRLEKYLAQQPRFDLVGVDIQGVSGLAEP